LLTFGTGGDGVVLGMIKTLHFFSYCNCCLTKPLYDAFPL
jgi:hypothetical protein